MLLAQLAKTSSREADRGSLSVEIADRHIRHSNVCSNHVEKRIIRLASVEDLQARQLQTLLVDLRRVGRHAPGISTAHLGPVGFVPREGEELVIDGTPASSR